MRIVKRIVLLLILAPTFVAFLHPYCSTLVASFLYPFTLVVIPMAIINVSVLVALLYKKSSWKWVYGGATVLSLVMISNSLGFSYSRQETVSKESVRLISWNVDNFMLSKDTLKKAAEFVHTLVPDIICIQERPHDSLLSWDTICKSLDYPFCVRNSREDEVLNLGIFSRWPLSDFRECYFSNTYNKFCQVDIHCRDIIFRFFNVHLQTTGTTDYVKGNFYKVLQTNAYYRNLQAEQLKDSIEKSPYPVIVCGDFNDTSLSYAYKQIKGNHLSDFFSEVGRGWGGSYQLLGNLFQIDHMMCSSDFKIIDYCLYSNFWSDHKIQYGEALFTTPK